MDWKAALKKVGGIVKKNTIALGRGTKVAVKTIDEKYADYEAHRNERELKQISRLQRQVQIEELQARRERARAHATKARDSNAYFKPGELDSMFGGSIWGDEKEVKKGG